MMTIALEEAPPQLSTLLEQVPDGEEVTVTRQGKPYARIIRSAEDGQLGIKETLRRIEEFSQRQAGKMPPMHELIKEGRKH